MEIKMNNITIHAIKDELSKLAGVSGGWKRLAKRLSDTSKKEYYLKNLSARKGAGREAQNAYLSAAEKASRQQHIRSRYISRFGAQPPVATTGPRLDKLAGIMTPESSYEHMYPEAGRYGKVTGMFTGGLYGAVAGGAASAYAGSKLRGSEQIAKTEQIAKSGISGKLQALVKKSPGKAKALALALIGAGVLGGGAVGANIGGNVGERVGGGPTV